MSFIKCRINRICSFVISFYLESINGMVRTSLLSISCFVVVVLVELLFHFTPINDHMFMTYFMHMAMNRKKFLKSFSII